jgi:transposase
MAGNGLESLSREALIQLVLAQAELIERLTARVAELEARLGKPPKTPGNSSVPPSKGNKASEPGAAKPKSRVHPGSARSLDPEATRTQNVLASSCSCGCDVSGTTQFACESYDRIDIPPIRPDVTRVVLHGGICPGCAKPFKAPAPVGLEPGSPFGPNLRARW